MKQKFYEVMTRYIKEACEAYTSARVAHFQNRKSDEAFWMQQAKIAEEKAQEFAAKYHNAPAEK